MTAERKRRISITKLQRQTAAGAELIALCQTVTEDGRLDTDEVDALKQWLSDNADLDLPAKDFLTETVERIIADGIVTPEERKELYLAVEKALPPDIRESVRGHRREVEEQEKAGARAAREAEKEEAREARKRNRPIATYDFMIAGFGYEGRPAIIRRHARHGEPAMLVRDPSNAFSHNAIEVQLANGMQIGYVPEELAREMAPALDAGHPVRAYVKKILTGGRSPIPVVVAKFFRTDADQPEIVIPEVGGAERRSSTPSSRKESEVNYSGCCLVSAILMLALMFACAVFVS